MTVAMATMGPLAPPVWAQDVPTDIMAEPTAYTNVLDAFEQGGAFDFAAELSYRYSQRSARLQREEPTASGRASEDFRTIGDSDQTVKELVFGLDLGVYRDLMVSVRVPFVLSDVRSVHWAGGLQSVSGAAAERLAAVLPLGQTFSSKPRFGFPGLELGLRYGLVNQYRTPSWPTWVLVSNLQLSTGVVQKPCADDADCDAGIAPPTSRLRLESRFSYRYRHAEPYLGLQYVYAYVATPGEVLYQETDGRSGTARPPDEMGLTTGVALIPWEDRRRFQRVTFDLRGHAQYVGAGQGPSELFDVLGTSELLAAHTTGITDIEAHLQLDAQARVEMRAARYVRFRALLALQHTTAHLITGARACGGTLDIDNGGATGTCGGRALMPAIDLPGQRFRLQDALAFAIRVSALGQF